MHDDERRLGPAAELALDGLLGEWAEGLWAELGLTEPALPEAPVVLSGDLDYAWWRAFHERVPYHNGTVPYSVWPKAV
ncbi:hypothetical protein I8J29_18675 [Paenibacillus sp. MWE-103]|uniref:Uncharacterized protein n=1 Tax=Paenibacillus artemisiicola TaxID=1172618 RepID=A0ABS3WD57_9BACL|nr:hypothetical protein [Paenibacillus artemisiicola]MBO7746237.1 hypothetical protein [Paenibacillus artemisiicola]